MIVLDVPAGIEWLLQTSAGQRIEQHPFMIESLHAPDLLYGAEGANDTRNLLLSPGRVRSVPSP